MNIYNEQDCINFLEEARTSNSSLPKDGNGGIWIQPLALPKPRLKNVEDIGTLICTKENYIKNNSKCKLDSENLNQKLLGFIHFLLGVLIQNLKFRRLIIEK